MSIVKTFPTLYGKDKSEKVRVWNCNVETGSGSATVNISHGTLDGKATNSSRTIKSGKNIGKKNETTVEEQAIREAEKSWKDKVEKEGYRENLEEITASQTSKPQSFDPMLAEKYDPSSKVKRKVDIVFPCFVQPKLDGIRCLTFLDKNGKLVNQSRKLKAFFHLDHINKVLMPIFSSNPDLVLDGELYNHDISFNQIAGIVKKEKCSQDDLQALQQIQYHIYDSFVYNQADTGFGDRWKKLTDVLRQAEKTTIKLVATSECAAATDLLDLHADVVSQGYEGIMLRNKAGPYEHSRSRHLQKYKTFMDDEFKVTGFHEGTGNDAGCVVWTCEAKNGKPFDVRPQGSVAERQQQFQSATGFLGKYLTVKYQELSEYGIPRFPVGIAFRDYE